jgi:hypothetical protein
MRLSALAFACIVSVGCSAREASVVAGCLTPDGAKAAVGGTLTILPSRLPGAEITQATWRTQRGHADGVVTEYLVLTTTLRANRRIAEDEVALLFDAPGAHAIVDNAIVDEGAEQFQLSRNATFLDSGAARTTVRNVPLRSALVAGTESSLDDCPSTVRLVPRNTLALELVPTLETAEGRSALLRRTVSKNASPLVVVMDTVVADGLGSTLIVGAAMNTTDSALTDMVVALIPAPVTRPGDSGGAPVADTLEYLVGTVPPHAVVPFAGGWLNPGDRIVGRTAYRATEIKGRPIAGDAEMHRSSEAGRALKMRARRGAECAANPDGCAK